MLAVMSGPDERDPSTLPSQDTDYVRAASGDISVRGKRIAFCPDLGGIVPIDREVKSLAQQAALTFQDLGCHVEEACIDASGLREIIAGTRGFGMMARFGSYADSERRLMTQALTKQIEAAKKLDVHTVGRSEKLRTQYWRRLAELMRSFDYLILPSCGAPPFRLDEPVPEYVNGNRVANFHDVFLMTYGISVVGLPVTAVPCGFTASGLPVGIQIIAHRHREDLAIVAATAYQAARPEHFRRPESMLRDPRKINDASRVIPEE
jgi:amidase